MGKTSIKTYYFRDKNRSVKATQQVSLDLIPVSEGIHSFLGSSIFKNTMLTDRDRTNFMEYVMPDGFTYKVKKGEWVVGLTGNIFVILTNEQFEALFFHDCPVEDCEV